MNRLILTTLAAAIALASPAFAHATEAYVVANVNLSSGPDEGYPAVAGLDAGTAVDVQGCTSGWQWCDVVAYGDRGWVPGNDLEYSEGDRWGYVPDYAPTIGIPIVSFTIGSYWDRYYHDRPFYGDRWRWYHHPVWNHNPPPRPHPMPYPPPHSGQHPHPMPYPPPHSGPYPHPMPYPPPHSGPYPHPMPYPPPQQGGQHPHPMPYPPPREPHEVPNGAAPASAHHDEPHNAASSKRDDQH